jgi:hypothetical protein
MSDTPQPRNPETELVMGSLAPDDERYVGRAHLVSFYLRALLRGSGPSSALLAAVTIWQAGASVIVAAPAVDCSNEAAIKTEPLVAAWPSRVRVGFGLLKHVDGGLIGEFQNAWRYSKGGTDSREGVILIFLKSSGVYEGRLQQATNEWRQSSFKWNPAAVAIVHTHPNSSSPEPSPEDEELAQRFNVPMFTITSRGMYVYDPYCNRTIRIMGSLDWLSASSWTPEVYERSLATLAAKFKDSRPISQLSVDNN